MDNKIGRNDPCPCGSGQKHKKCCFGKTAKPKFTAKVIKSGPQENVSQGHSVDLMGRFMEAHQTREEPYEMTKHDFRLPGKESQTAQ